MSIASKQVNRTVTQDRQICDLQDHRQSLWATIGCGQWNAEELAYLPNCKAHAQPIDVATGTKESEGFTDCDGAGLALRGGAGVEADEGVCLIAGVDLQPGLPRCEERGQRVGGLVVRKLQVVAACALGRVQKQWSGGCTTITVCQVQHADCTNQAS